jgi:hypothetical protein
MVGCQQVSRIAVRQAGGKSQLEKGWLQEWLAFRETTCWRGRVRGKERIPGIGLSPGMMLLDMQFNVGSYPLLRPGLNRNTEPLSEHNWSLRGT